MAETKVREKRLEWIDWMKALGIYLIVLGHFYSVCEKSIYVFHVSLFFVISGFLNKKEDDGQVFWKKLWYNLTVPMLLMAVINFGYHNILQFFNGSFSPADAYWFVRNIAFGMVSGYDTLWFVFTLMMLKIIFQYCYTMKLFYSLSVVMMVLAYVYNHSDLSGLPFFLKEPNAVVDLCTAYPFFALGILLRNYKEMINALNTKVMLIAAFVCGFLLVALCYAYNGNVGMFRCDYGGSIFLFLIGGVAGTVMIWVISVLFGYAPKVIAIISRGTIIILGLHKELIDLVWAFVTPSVLDVVFAALILLLFIPFIIATEKYFPLMAGKYRVKLSNG
jgi:fucose 4-O-acetylase-like acetyltransferase